MLLWFAEGLLLSRVETKDRFWDIFSKESEVSDFLALSLLRTNISSLPSHYLSFFFFFFFFYTPLHSFPLPLLYFSPLHLLPPFPLPFFFFFFFIRHSILSPSPYFTSLPYISSLPSHYLSFFFFFLYATPFFPPPPGLLYFSPFPYIGG